MLSRIQIVTFLAASGILIGCAPAVKVIGQFDTAEGYRKTVRFEVTRNLQKLKKERVTIFANKSILTVHESPLVTTKDQFSRQITLRDSEYLQRADQNRLSYDLYYASFFEEEQKTKLEAKILASDAATYNLRAPKACYALGDKIPIFVDLKPLPRFDTVNFRILKSGTGGNCVALNSDILSSKDKSAFGTVTCTGLVQLAARALDRPLLRAGTVAANVRLANAVVAPSARSFAMGELFDQRNEDGDGTTTVRQVKLTWAGVPGAEHYAVVILNARGESIDETLFAGTENSYLTGLPPRDTYTWTVSAQVTGCSNTAAWSDPTIPQTIDLR